MPSATFAPAPAASPARLPAPLPPDRAALAPILVLGGGPIGLVCALLLARHGWRCTLVDARPLEALRHDRRLLALSRGTLHALEPLLGARFAPRGDITRIHVSSRGEPGSAWLGGNDFDGLPVGATVWYADLVAALAQAVQDEPLVQVLRPRRALHVRQGAQAVDVDLDDASVLSGRLAIDAEGTPGHAAAATHCALLAELELPLAAGVAIERFTREGPLALLPLPASDGASAPAPDAGPRRLSMIWCLPATLAQERQALPDAQLCARIGEALGARLGTPSAVSQRSVFPLLTHRRKDVCEHRLVRLGNAAQSLHPVAGQGFNLGIRDCQVLLQCLIDDPLEADATGGLRALRRYAARRRIDRSLFPALTNALPAVFASQLGPVVAARGAALAAIDMLPGLRRSFTRLLMYGAAR